MYLIPLSGAISCFAGLVGVVTKAFLFSDSVAEGPATSVKALAPVFYVTAGFICLLYTFFFYQSTTAFLEHAKARKEAKAKDAQAKSPRFTDVKYGRTGKMLAADRTVGNLLEQAVPFLVSMYMHAALVSSSQAATIGWVWVASRSIYPFVFPMAFPAIFASTLPSYTCIIFMLGTALLEL